MDGGAVDRDEDRRTAFHGHALDKPISGFRFGYASNRIHNTRLLVVETSPRGDYSVSRNMTRRFVAYKQAKSVMRIKTVASLAGTGGGKDSFWEDNADYQWYADI